MGAAVVGAAVVGAAVVGAAVVGAAVVGAAVEGAAVVGAAVVAGAAFVVGAAVVGAVVVGAAVVGAAVVATVTGPTVVGATVVGLAVVGAAVVVGVGQHQNGWTGVGICWKRDCHWFVHKVNQSFMADGLGGGVGSVGVNGNCELHGKHSGGMIGDAVVGAGVTGAGVTGAGVDGALVGVGQHQNGLFCWTGAAVVVCGKMVCNGFVHKPNQSLFTADGPLPIVKVGKIGLRADCELHGQHSGELGRIRVKNPLGDGPPQRNSGCIPDGANW